MKTLSFHADQEVLYRFAYQSAMNPQFQLTGRAQVRTHAALCDQLESIGVKNEQGGFTLREGGGAIQLEGPQFDLLVKMIDASPPFPNLSRQVAPLYDILDKAPDYVPPPAAPLALTE